MRFKSGIRAGLWWVPLVSLLAVLPYFWRGTSNGHDLTFHVNSWIDVVRQWHEGIVYPHWAAFANYGNGEPRFVFYPPISWIFGAFLGSFLPWQAVPGTMEVLVCIAAGISMYLFASEWLDERIAVLAAILYAVNPYQLVVMYERGAFAEMIASIWIPGILLFALRERGGFARNTLLLALHVAAVWLTNLPAAVIASYLLAFVVILRAIQLRSAEPLFRAAAAMALGLALAGFYLVPAVYEQRWVQIGQAVSSGASPRENFLFAHTADAEHDAVLLRTSILAVLEFVALAVCAGFAGSLRHRDRRLYNLLLAVAILPIFLMLPLSTLVWQYAPKLMFVQFPWRWLLVLNVALAFFAGVVFAQLRARWALVLIVPLLIGICYWRFQQVIYPEDRPIALADTIRSGDGYEGTDEYAPLQSDNSNLSPGMPRIAIRIATQNEDQRKLPPGSLAHSTFHQWSAEHKRFTIDSQVPTLDTIRLLQYPAWQVSVDGHPYRPEVDDSDGRMILALPAGHHDIAIDYSTTPDRTWGAILSVLAAAVTLFLYAFVRRRPHTPLQGLSS